MQTHIICNLISISCWRKEIVLTDQHLRNKDLISILSRIIDLKYVAQKQTWENDELKDI